MSYHHDLIEKHLHITSVKCMFQVHYNIQDINLGLNGQQVVPLLPLFEVSI